MENLNEIGLVEMEQNQLKETDGGFVALTILGVTYTAAQVAGAAVALFAAGVGVGVSLASGEDEC